MYETDRKRVRADEAGEKALQVLKDYWGGMINEGADTFWELYDPKDPEASPYGGSIVNSYCHAWSCAPFFAVAGEVHNSDSSSPEYMEKIWKIADDLGLNTLLLPVSWELTEPEEGVFDFSIPDALIRQAREWKNA
ncbi:MAG: beta-galactosidase [Firmicutes bacterium]|nr:beta-galactosidase [Bacillota bacterium]